MIDIRDMERRVTPLVEETSRMLDAHKLEQEQMREILIRYDEIISEKVSKNAHEILEKELRSNYV
jgi:hypothetical protein